MNKAEPAHSSSEVQPQKHPAHEILTSALAADALDQLGLRHQCLGPDVRPLAADQRVVGRAFPVTSIPAVEVEPAVPYKGLMAALDVLQADAVFVFYTGRSDAAGVWGELITTACVANGVAGALTDGLVRDVTRLIESAFPVFSRGATPYDSKGRIDVIAHGDPVTIDDVLIRPDDLIVGDADGVCVIPAEYHDEVLSLVRAKSSDETQFRQAIRSGMQVSAAFRKYGVL